MVEKSIDEGRVQALTGILIQSRLGSRIELHTLVPLGDEVLLGAIAMEDMDLVVPASKKSGTSIPTLLRRRRSRGGREYEATEGPLGIDFATPDPGRFVEVILWGLQVELGRLSNPALAAERVDVRRLTATNACLRCSRELEYRK